MSVLVIRSVKVAVDGGEEGGLLVTHADVLVAVLTYLSDPMYEADRGRWFLEAGFGRCAARQDTFATLDAALRWVAGRLGLDADAAIAPALASHEDARPDGASSAI